jgi:hypothetical protein
MNKWEGTSGRTQRAFGFLTATANGDWPVINGRSLASSSRTSPALKPFSTEPA